MFVKLRLFLLAPVEKLVNLWDAHFYLLRSKLIPASLDSTLVLLSSALATSYTASTYRREGAKLSFQMVASI